MKIHEQPAPPIERADDVPPQNVLDLRHHAVRHPEPPSRGKTLETFWRKKHAPTVKPPRVVRTHPRIRAMRPLLGAPAMRIKALASRVHLGAFPVIAAVILLIFGAVGAYGQVIGVRNKVFSFAQTGYDSLKVAGVKAESRDLASARAALENASQSFASAESAFSELNPTLSSVVSRVPLAGSKLNSGRHLVSAARSIADAGAEFTTLAAPLTAQGQGFSNIAGLLKNIDANQRSLDLVVTNLQSAVDELALVRSSDLPAQYRDQVSRIQEVLPGLRASLTNLSNGMHVLTDVFGVNAASEYLFIFQNSNELRPTGGFIGSFALLRMDNGAFKMLDAPSRGSFDIDQYLPATVTPPKPLQVINAGWYFRDANWYPDFPTSAEQLSAFYEQARGFRPHGIIAFTPQLIEELLAITGPITLTQYKVTIDETNFTEVSQQQVEQNYDLRANNPKQFVVDLIPAIADRLSKLEMSQYPQLVAAFAKSAFAGDVQIWSSAAALQQQIQELGWSGSMSASNGDFLELVNTNIGGGKTDGVMRDVIKDRAVVAEDGTVTVTVELTRTHGGAVGDPFTGSENRTYHRFYVPLGSKLIDAEGFTPELASSYQPLPAGSKPDALLTSIEGRVTLDEASGTRSNDEFGKTVFGNWTSLEPGQSATVRLTYELPFKVVGSLDRYDLLVGKQAGARNQTIDFALSVSENDSIVWTSFWPVRQKNSSTEYSMELDAPRSLSVVIQQKEK